MDFICYLLDWDVAFFFDISFKLLWLLEWFVIWSLNERTVFFEKSFSEAEIINNLSVYSLIADETQHAC